MAATASSGWRRAFPGLAQILTRTPGAWRADALAGATVAVVMIPSVLAYAELVRLPPAAGLYAAIGSMAIYAPAGSTGPVPALPRLGTSGY